MDEGWIITTAITLGIGVISYFLKRTMNQLDCTVQQLQKIERDSVTKADLKETTDELKKDIDLINLDDEISDAFRYEILITGKTLYCKDEFKFEMYKLDMYREFLELNESRQMIINRIKNGGDIYGKRSSSNK